MEFSGNSSVFVAELAATRRVGLEEGGQLEERRWRGPADPQD
jgi:hypothetical protein